MSETETPRDDATGQFSPSTEGLFGQEAELAKAGFKPMPDRPKPEAEEFKSPREAADELSASRGAAPVVEVAYQKAADGERADETEAVTVERAARDLAAYRSANADSAAKSISNDFAAEIDAMRAEAIKGNPKRAEHLGLEVADADSKAAKPEISSDSSKNADEAAIDDPTAASIDSMDGLDPETKEALKKPQIRAALEEEFGKAQHVQQSFTQALSTVQSWAQASFLESFPELAGLPAEQLEQGLTALAQVDPPRFNAAMSLLNRVQAIQAAQHQQQQRQAEIARQNFNVYAKEQDANFEAMVGKMTPAESAQFGGDLLSYAGELGIDQGQLVHLLQNEPIMRHAAFQRMVHDAVKYRQVQKASKAVAHKALPPVMRPGTSNASRASDSSSQINSLERKMGSANATQQLKLAAQITSLKRSARR